MADAPDGPNGTADPRLANAIAQARELERQKPGITIGDIRWSTDYRWDIGYVAKMWIVTSALNQAEVTIVLDGSPVEPLILNKHRANYEAMLKTGGRLKIARQLANAIRTLPPQYLADIYTEILKVKQDRGANPKNPRKRNISNLSFKSGRLEAPITLVRGVRIINDAVTLDRVLPEIIRQSIVGRPMTDIIGHHWLENIVARKVSLTDNGRKTAIKLSVESEWLDDIEIWLANTLAKLSERPKS